MTFIPAGVWDERDQPDGRLTVQRRDQGSSSPRVSSGLNFLDKYQFDNEVVLGYKQLVWLPGLNIPFLDNSHNMSLCYQIQFWLKHQHIFC